MARARLTMTTYVANARLNAPNSSALTERAMRIPRRKFVKLEMPWSRSAQPARPASRPARPRRRAVASATGGRHLIGVDGSGAGPPVGQRVAIHPNELLVVDLGRVAVLVAA